MGLEPVAFRATYTLFVDAINNSAANSLTKTHPSDKTKIYSIYNNCGR